nr:MAG TPA: hypothetical protein [Caudoviricetes sp.]
MCAARVGNALSVFPFRYTGGVCQRFHRPDLTGEKKGEKHIV